MDKEDFLKLGYKIKYLRNKKQLSQLDLSLKTGLTTRTISRIECGSIAEALETNLIELLNFSL